MTPEEWEKAWSELAELWYEEAGDTCSAFLLQTWARELAKTKPPRSCFPPEVGANIIRWRRTLGISPPKDPELLEAWMKKWGKWRNVK